MSNTKSYLGYRPKPNNITKLKQYISGTNQVNEKLPNPKPVKSNKKNGK